MYLKPLRFAARMFARKRRAVSHAPYAATAPPAASTEASVAVPMVVVPYAVRGIGVIGAFCRRVLRGRPNMKPREPTTRLSSGHGYNE